MLRGQIMGWEIGGRHGERWFRNQLWPSNSGADSACMGCRVCVCCGLGGGGSSQNCRIVVGYEGDTLALRACLGIEQDGGEKERGYNYSAHDYSPIGQE
jgi:hypothetical protein